MTIEIQVDKPPDDAASLNLHLDQPQVSSQPTLSCGTSLISQTSQNSQQEPGRWPVASTDWTSHVLGSRLAGNQPSTPRSLAPAPTGSNKLPTQSSPGNASIPINHTMANSSAIRVAPAKRQKTNGSQSQLSETSGSIDWNARLPSGNEFTESLKAALTSLKPQIERLEQLLTSINDEHCGLAAVRRSLYSSKDKLAKDLEKAQECLIDVEESTATEEEIVRDLEGVYKKHPGDNKLRAFLDGRKKTVIEYQKVYIIVKSQLGKSSAELSKTEREIQSVNRRLGQLEAERAEVMKEKEGADKAMKSMMFMSQFMERGWQASVDSFGQAFGDEAVQTAF
ncbi:uncharacterized protein BKA55DRAFT_695852 [Fusarium redolens]|uniref:Uncharacterized protein n=1 Tax=Fusarium redolens TaxID=48865 RepID=A0A9P9G357_FUSRE|nr:uncharacterized protein BKA55DRAFT_695852 [Fusarium redolens]KAH7231621.1 hypothetical protein BKA55DRAFT_695852 [Fusarium redolens]